MSRCAARSHEHVAADRGEPGQRAIEHRPEDGAGQGARLTQRAPPRLERLGRLRSPSQRVESLARDIVGETASPAALEMARRFAEAQIDLDRIRSARYHACLLALDEGTRSEAGAAAVELIVRERVRQLKSLDRYERRALSRRRSATRALDPAFFEAVAPQDLPE
jgi:hypothetical protein